MPIPYFSARIFVADQFTALIDEAEQVLRGVALVTPIVTSERLDATAAATVFLKCENLQRSGAFKFRGAYHAVSHWASTTAHRTFVTVSSGNHAQGLALACGLLGCKAHVVMPRNSSPLKRDAARSNGAAIYESDDRPSANVVLAQLARELPAVVIHPFNDPLVIAGQGTVMIELLHQVADLDAVLAPIGGGGLLAGLCLAAKTRKPGLKLYACEPAGALDAVESVRQNRIIPMDHPQTIADGLRTSVGDRTLPILREGLAGFYVVSEEEIMAAMRFARDRLDLTIEPSSAVALAPVLRREVGLVGKRVGVVLTGGNVNLSMFWPQAATERRGR